ncbi:MAG: NHL repeat-containing protein [bacterium]
MDEIVKLTFQQVLPRYNCNPHISPAFIYPKSDNTLLIVDKLDKKIFNYALEEDNLSKIEIQIKGFSSFCPACLVLCNERVYITDCSHHCVHVLDKDFFYRLSFGLFGTREGEFNTPSSLAVDKNGQIFISDQGNHSIKVFNSEGRFIYSLGKRGVPAEDVVKQSLQLNNTLNDLLLEFPNKIVIGEDNNIWVIGKGTQVVQKIKPDGKILHSFCLPDHILPLDINLTSSLVIILGNDRSIYLYKLNNDQTILIKKLDLTLFEKVIFPSCIATFKNKVFIGDSINQKVYLVEYKEQIKKGVDLVKQRGLIKREEISCKEKILNNKVYSSVAKDYNPLIFDNLNQNQSDELIFFEQIIFIKEQLINLKERVLKGIECLADLEYERDLRVLKENTKNDQELIKLEKQIHILETENRFYLDVITRLSIKLKEGYLHLTPQKDCGESEIKGIIRAFAILSEFFVSFYNEKQSVFINSVNLTRVNQSERKGIKQYNIISLYHKQLAFYNRIINQFEPIILKYLECIYELVNSLRKGTEETRDFIDKLERVLGACVGEIIFNEYDDLEFVEWLDNNLVSLLYLIKNKKCYQNSISLDQEAGLLNKLNKVKKEILENGSIETYQDINEIGREIFNWYSQLAGLRQYKATVFQDIDSHQNISTLKKFIDEYISTKNKMFDLLQKETIKLIELNGILEKLSVTETRQRLLVQRDIGIQSFNCQIKRESVRIYLWSNIIEIFHFIKGINNVEGLTMLVELIERLELELTEKEKMRTQLIREINQHNSILKGNESTAPNNVIDIEKKKFLLWENCFELTLLLCILPLIRQLQPSPKSDNFFQFDFMFGCKGNKEGCFNGPYHIACDNKKNFLITEYHSHRVQKFSPEGGFIFSFGGYGSRPCLFKNPTGITIDDEGKIYVCDTFNHRIQLFSSQGEFIRSIGSYGNNPGEFNMPGRIVFDKKKYIYITDFQNHRIQQLDYEGRFVKSFGREGGGFCGLYIDDQEGIVIVTDIINNNIQFYTTSGEYVDSFGKKGTDIGEFDLPVNVIMDSKRRLYISDMHNQRIQVIENRQVISVIGKLGRSPGEFYRPTSCLIIDNFLWVVDRSNNRIQKFIIND